MPHREVRRVADRLHMRPRPRSPHAQPRHRPLRAICASASLIAALLACAQPLPRGDGPTTLVVHASEIQAPSGRMVGRMRIEVIDYEDTCPRLFDRSLLGMRKLVQVVAKDDEPLQVGLVPEHVYKVSIQHRSAGDALERACESVFWFKPVEGARYEVALRSDLERCSVVQVEPRTAVLEPFAACEQARTGGSPAPASSGTTNGRNEAGK